MKTDIRSKTALIVKRAGVYLVGMGVCLRWSNSPYDAWNTRDINAAHMVANKVGGKLLLFNPVAGQIRDFKGV